MFIGFLFHHSAALRQERNIERETLRSYGAPRPLEQPAINISPRWGETPASMSLNFLLNPLINVSCG